jgi:hypothetical protein
MSPLEFELMNGGGALGDAAPEPPLFLNEEEIRKD